MKSGCCWALAFLVALAGLAHAAAPAVTNVRAAQRPGTGLVDITYDLADADTATLFVSLSVSTNGGATFFSPAADVSGAVGHVARGNGKAILWNAKSELPEKLFANMRAMVTADDDWAPPPPPGMVLIPAGTNTGADAYGTYLTLIVREPFYMDATEVTKAKWDEVYNWAITNRYSFAHGGVGYGKAANHPVHSVFWEDVTLWCVARSAKEGRSYRLPTEIEWQYAARGGLTGRNFPWGDIITHNRANYSSYWYNGVPYYTYDQATSPGSHPSYATGGYPYTSPVGSFAANGYGLYDMAGNVAEWCQDYNSPWGTRLAAGGSWANSAYTALCRRGDLTDPADAWNTIGFRTVCR